MADAYGIKFYPQSGQFAKQIGEFTAADKLLASGAVASGKLADGSVNTVNVSSGAIVSGKLGDGSVNTVNVSSGAITSGKMGDGSVNTGNVASGAIVSGKLGDGSVNTGNVASGAITSGKIGEGAISSGNIASGQVGSAHLASGITVEFARATIDDTNYTAAEPISGGYCVSINSNGELITANAFDPDRMPAIGFLNATIASGDAGAVYTQGVIELAAVYDFTGDVRKTVFVGSGGWPTVQSPSASGTWIQWMGMVAGVTKIAVDVETQIYGNAPIV